MSRDLREIIKELKSQVNDPKQEFLYFKEKEENDPKTNIIYNGLEGFITQQDLLSSTWDMGPFGKSVATNTCLLMDPWGEENRLRMMFPLAEWVRLDKVIRDLGITLQPVFTPWEFIGIGFMLNYLNGYHMIYPWGSYVLLRPATKPIQLKKSIDRNEHEMTLSVRLKSVEKRATKDRINLCLNTKLRQIPGYTYNVSGDYFSSSAGVKIARKWNNFCEQNRKMDWLSDGIVFQNAEGNLIAAGGDNIEDIAVVYEKERIIVSPGVCEGNLPGTTMVTFFLIGEANGYNIEMRPITLDDLKKCDYGVVSEMSTLIKWDNLLDINRREEIQVSKRNEYRFHEVFIKSFIRMKHGDSKLLGLPRIIEKGEEWFPGCETRQELALRGLNMKRAVFESHNWRNITVNPPEGEISFKRRRIQIAHLYGKYWE